MPGCGRTRLRVDLASNTIDVTSNTRSTAALVPHNKLGEINMARQKERHATANAARSREAITDDRGWVDAASRSWADYLIDSDPRSRDQIERWWATTPPEPMVGSRHHTVPRSYLERFAAAGQIYVRDRVTGIGALRNVKDTGAIKDFYTSINLDGQLDGRLERILSDIEGGAETVFRRLLNPFRKPRSLDPD